MAHLRAKKAPIISLDMRIFELVSARSVVTQQRCGDGKETKPQVLMLYTKNVCEVHRAGVIPLITECAYIYVYRKPTSEVQSGV